MSTQNPRPRSRPWKWLRRLLICFVAFITFIALIFAEENWRGKRAWENYRREWEAKGEKFDLKDFIPPPVPDDQNFAMTPFLAPLFDFNPEPLQPGQNRWRDTNGLARIYNFAKDFPDLKRLIAPSTAPSAKSEVFVIPSTTPWAKSEVMDMNLWAIAFREKTNKDRVAGIELPKGEAAKFVLRALEEYKPVLDEIQMASRRPYARFNIRYEEENPAGILLPHAAIMKKIATVLQLRASAELALGRTDEALADTILMLRLCDSLQNEPFLISGLVRIAMLQMALQPVWEGLAAHQWSDAQLIELGNRLGRYDLLPEFSIAVRGERAMGNGVIDYLRRRRRLHELDGVNSGDGTPTYRGSAVGYVIPGGWFYQNQLAMSQMHQEFNLPPVDAAKHRVYPEKAKSSLGSATKELQSGFRPYKNFAMILFPAVSGASLKFANAQTCLEEATLACALERFHLANKQYPETLDALAPKYIKAIPHDITTGEALKYRRNSDGTFLLYSIGWNEKDDGGKVEMFTSKSATIDTRQGDWVWPAYPAR